jgi:hypothetical protein
VPSPPTFGSGAHEWRSRYGRTTWAQLASIATIVRRRRRGGPGQVYGHLQVVQGCPTAPACSASRTGGGRLADGLTDELVA